MTTENINKIESGLNMLVYDYLDNTLTLKRTNTLILLLILELSTHDQEIKTLIDQHDWEKKL